MTEESKWLYVHRILCRPKLKLESETVQTCSEAIREIGSQIRASYGEKIDMGKEELARMMLLDGCFLLEHLIRLTMHEARVDEEMNSRLLTDLTVVDNQIPFVVLTTSSSTLLEHLEDAQQPELARLRALSRQVGSKVKLSPENIAESLFKCNADFSKGVYHFLHLIHLCSPDPYKEVETGEAKLQLLRGARKLQAFGITITASQTDDSKGLVRSVHDLQLLKDEGVISVHKKVKDEDLVEMFRSITTGAERMDARYKTVCEGLNNAEVNGVAGCCVLVFRMPWHYWRCFVEGTKFHFFSLAYIFLGTAWRKAGVFSGVALFGLTTTQTVYAIRAVE